MIYEQGLYLISVVVHTKKKDVPILAVNYLNLVLQ